jgi:DNA-binding NtrC family response regulator
VDCRIVSATHRDLEELVTQHAFREDLFFRLAGLVLELPALRDRPGDVSILANHFAQGARPPRRLSSGATAALEGYAWPGNVRELKNVLDRAMALFPDIQLEAEHLTMGRVKMGGSRNPRPTPPGAPSIEKSHSPAVPQPPTPPSQATPPPMTLEEAERVAILSALHASGGNKSRAARSLDISRQTLRDKMVRYGIRSGEDE